jgi:hypothetical protein
VNLGGKNLQYTTFHRKAGEYIITGPVDSNGHFYRGYIDDDNVLKSTKLWDSNISPQMMSYAGSFYLIIGEYTSISRIIWRVGNLSGFRTNRYDTVPNAIEMKETSSANIVVMYYTKASVGSTYTLYKDVADLSVPLSNSVKTLESIGNN